MVPIVADRPVAPPDSTSRADLVPGYAALLAAHRRGRPLLTRRGLAHVRRALRAAGVADPAVPARPVWDPVRRRLWLGERLLRAFGRAAPGQAAVLDAFQAHRWTRRPFPDPLPPEPGEEPGSARRRLHETVKNLNRGLPRVTIRFRENGRVVWWEPLG
jgi:hypothetical protein